MAADFPDNPNVNDTFTVGDRTWIWNGTTWDGVTEEVFSADAPITFNSSTRTVGIDETAIAIDQDQVTGLADGTSGHTAVSDGTSLTYQPVSHNYIINGAFDIWQRGTSFATDGYTADRWLTADSGATVSTSRQSFSSGDIEAIGFGDAKYFLRYDVTTGNNNAAIYQYVEDVRTLAGQTVTLSFYAKGTNPGGGSFTVLAGQIFGSGGSAAVTETDTLTVTSTWTKYSFTFDLPSVVSKTIGDGSYVRCGIRQPSGDTSTDAWTLDLWGVQLEAGSIATPFKRNANSIQGELAACQRYYYEDSSTNVWRITGFARDSSNARAVYTFPTTMRANPSVEFAGDWRISYKTSDSTDVTLSVQAGTEAGGSKDRIEVRAVTGTGFLTAGEGIVIKGGSSSAQFKASAEL